MSESDAPVAIVCSNTSNNCLGRALLLADLIRHRASTKIVGFQRRRTAWAPARDNAVPVESRRLDNAFGFRRAARWLRQELLGHRVIVSKPLYTSLGLALRAGLGKAEFLLDVDDWEVGLYRTHSSVTNLVHWINPFRIDSFWATNRIDSTIAECPHRTVSNRWLQDRYGGVLLPHLRDTDKLDPARVDRRRERDAHGMNGRFWVGFVGSLRIHKGVEDLVAAVAQLDDGVGLYIAGVEANHEYGERLVAHARSVLPAERLRVLPEFPLEQLPKRLALADVLCTPSRALEAAEGQIPAKLFDAMAMGVPAIVTRVNDMPHVLGAGGLSVPPGDPDALAQAIARLYQDPAACAAYGKRARERAVAEYGYGAGRAALESALSPIMAWRPR